MKENAVLFLKDRDRLPPLRIGLIGDWTRLEFEPIVESIEATVRNGTTILEKDENGSFQNEATFDLFFLFQKYPGQISLKKVQSLRRGSPLASFVLIAGALCEGEGRTGRILPGIVRVYWRQWNSLGEFQFKRFLERKSGLFSLSPTALDEDFYQPRSLDDRRAFETDESRSVRWNSPFLPNASDVFWIVTDGDLEMRKLWIDLADFNDCETIEAFSLDAFLRLTPNDLANVVSPTRILIDSVELNDSLFNQVRFVANGSSSVRIDLLAFEPRVEDVRRFESLPGCHILSKPFWIDSL